jgi:DNA-binding response OmpR family regulator
MMAEPFDGKSILVVDDDTDILGAIELALKEKGADVLTAVDGTTATNLTEEKNPDLLVLDAMLPQRSGFLVLEKLKAKKARDGKPHVIMITANTGKRHQMWAESLGADDYINKPFRMEKLVESASKLLGKNS